MSEEPMAAVIQDPTIRPKKSLLRRVATVCGVILLLILGSGLISAEIPFAFLALFLFLISGILPVAWLCLVGWIMFLGRVARQIQVDPWSITCGIGAFVALIFAIQSAIRRLAPQRTWNLSQTFRCIAGTMAVFAAGICLLGVGHEIAWMFRSRTPAMIVIDTFRDNFYGRRSKNNLQQIGRAVNQYASDSHNLPLGGSFALDGTAGHGWLTLLLPYTDSKAIYDEIDFNRPWYDPVNRHAFATQVPAYESPRLKEKGIRPDGYAPSSYAANDRLLNVNQGLALSEITDGLANTILAGEVNQKFRPWGDAANWRNLDLGINQSPDGFGGDDKKVEGVYPFELPSQKELQNKIQRGVSFLLADGTVRFINENVDPKVLHALATPSGEETVGGY